MITNMTNTRTDVHRPSSEDFDPEKYDLAGVFDLHPEWGDGGYRMQVVNRFLDQGYRFASHQCSGQCGHCGARIRYAALMLHQDTHSMIYVGEQCLGNRFELTKDEFQRLRKTAALNKKRMSLNEAVAAFVEENSAAFPQLHTLLDSEKLKDCGTFVNDVARNLRTYGALTERQLDAVCKAIIREDGWAEINAAREAEQAARIASVPPAPEGKVIVTGLIEHTWVKDGDFGPQQKMRVRHDDGWIVLSTVPAAVLSLVEDPTELIGRRIEFVATLSQKRDFCTQEVIDPTTAFARRPSRARLI